MTNPYRNVHRITASRSPFNFGGVLLCLAAIAAAPLAKPSLLHFLPSEDLGIGMEGIAFRLAILIAAALALRSYRDVVRGEDRAVLEPHPIQPIAVLHAIATQCLLQTWTWVLATWLLIWPLAWDGHVVAFFWTGVLILSSWLGMVGVGYMVHLGSVWTSRNPALYPLLDVIRGSNPREQAAFLYGPSIALFGMGLVLMVGAKAIIAVSRGGLIAGLWLFLPIVIGLLSFLIARKLALKQYVIASAVLSEIDAKWAALEQAEESHRVYLDWLAEGRREFLRALRQGWRRLRIWPIGAWGFGALAFIAAWSGDLRSALLIAGGGVVIISAIPAMLAAGDPIWLDKALGVKGVEVGQARFLVAFLYAQGAILLPAVLLFRHWQAVILLEILALVCALIAAILSVKTRGQALWLYSPLGLLLWAVLGRFLRFGSVS